MVVNVGIIFQTLTLVLVLECSAHLAAVLSKYSFKLKLILIYSFFNYFFLTIIFLRRFFASANQKAIASANQKAKQYNGDVRRFFASANQKAKEYNGDEAAQ
jgi:ABC-type bacteriocin/lantibiotic exporter with double-glycine peptidase domain